jgi:hypothetical protein
MLLLLLLTLDLARTLRGKSVLQLPPIIDRWERKTIPPMHAHERRRRRRRRRSRIILPIPGVFPAIAGCGRSKKGALEDEEESKHRNRKTREERRKGKGQENSSKTATYHSSFICYIPSYLQDLLAYLPT